MLDFVPLARAFHVALWMVLLTLTLSACKPAKNTYIPPPPPDVTVATPIRKVVPETIEVTGRTRGVETVEVRARVKGFLAKKHVEGGERVTPGQLLFTIDPRTFDAAVAQAQAEVEAMKANLRLSDVTLKRLEVARAANATSQQEVDKALADRDAATAQVAIAEAKLEAAKLDQEFTRIKAPIAGRLGMITIDEGQLVGASEATLLATIINDERIYADYDIDERKLLELRKLNNNTRPGENGRPRLVVRMGLANDLDYPFVGEYSKSDNTVTPGTGTIRIEAVFPNADGTIIPGLFVRLQGILGEREALLVPDAAVLSDQSGRYVLIVNEKNIVERRAVTVGPVIERMRRIDDGLDLSSRVVVNGLQRARPGSPVNPQVASTSPPPTTPTAPTSPTVK